MDFLELVRKRSSVRSYQAKEIEAEKLEYILECARIAPSACNKQPWHFFVIRGEEGKEKIKRCYNRDWFTAPLYLLACGDISQSWKRSSDSKDHADVDVSIAFEHICLAATEQGLGTCWVCNFDVALCKELFRLSENLVPIAITPLGYPAKEDTNRTSRKNMEDIVSYL